MESRRKPNHGHLPAVFVQENTREFIEVEAQRFNLLSAHKRLCQVTCQGVRHACPLHADALQSLVLNDQISQLLEYFD